MIRAGAQTDSRMIASAIFSCCLHFFSEQTTQVETRQCTNERKRDTIDRDLEGERRFFFFFSGEFLVARGVYCFTTAWEEFFLLFSLAKGMLTYYRTHHHLLSTQWNNFESPLEHESMA